MPNQLSTYSWSNDTGLRVSNSRTAPATVLAMIAAAAIQPAMPSCAVGGAIVMNATPRKVVIDATSPAIRRASSMSSAA